jgi:hypothetical protein
MSNLRKSPFDDAGSVVGDLPIPAGRLRLGAFKGEVTLNGATPVTVAAAGVEAGSLILFTLKTVGGTVGAVPSIKTITAGTGFTVAGTALDTSIYNWAIIAN